jgi:predicted small metal-binding protein
MPSIRCSDAGATCKVPITAPTKEELMQKLVDHLITIHNVRPPTKTILNYLETKIRY